MLSLLEGNLPSSKDKNQSFFLLNQTLLRILFVLSELYLRMIVKLLALALTKLVTILAKQSIGQPYH